MLVFATNNKHKLSEIRQILKGHFLVMSLADLGFREEIPESQPDIAGNALQKAQYIYDRYQKDCFADDTGLMVDALDGAPGVYSARYAGPDATYADNVRKLLQEMEGIRGDDARTARFITVIALIRNGKEYLFEGAVEGTILTKPAGTGGFGYDPVFRPIGSDKSFAEMDADEKNKISHRGRAVRKLTEFLLSNEY